MRILIIEGDVADTALLKMVLGSRKFNYEAASSGKEGKLFIHAYEYDLVLIDVELTDMGGIELVRELRSSNNRVPIIMLGSCSTVARKIECLDAGADDYVVKPFYSDELAARIRAVVRRSCGHAASIIRIGMIEVNLTAHSVRVNGMPLRVTRREYQTLELLALRNKTPVSKAAFLNHLYGGDSYAPDYTDIVEVFVFKLRKKIRVLSGGVPIIETVRGIGYILQDCPTPTDQIAA